MKETDSFISLGKIVKPHGIKGAVQIYPYSDSDLLLKTETLYISDDQGRNVPFHVSWARSKKKNALIIQFSKVTDRNFSEQLTGKDVFIDKAKLPQLDPEEYYHFQLKGLKVYDSKRGFTGHIQGILDAGGNDILVIKDKGNKEIMIPAVKEFLMEIDFVSGICKVNIPDGLYDLNNKS